METTCRPYQTAGILHYPDRNVYTPIEILPKFVPVDPIDSYPDLIRIVIWCDWGTDHPEFKYLD